MNDYPSAWATLAAATATANLAKEQSLRGETRDLLLANASETGIALLAQATAGIEADHQATLLAISTSISAASESQRHAANLYAIEAGNAAGSDWAETLPVRPMINFAYTICCTNDFSSCQNASSANSYL